MPNRFVRPLLIVVFLIAIEAWLTLWAQTGGQYHLDLMFWPWKLGLTLAAASLITALTGRLIRDDGSVSKASVIYAALLFAVAVTAGFVTYYYHMNEPADDQSDDEPTTSQTLLTRPGTRWQPPLAYPQRS